MIDIERNNLDASSSPYLKQHAGDPIHWQEWNEETLRAAKERDKLILVSIGYSTCHWCHVMANEAFGDQDVADYLNDRYVAIKVDREERPEIDSYFMAFAQKTLGAGGWPLNVILSPEGRPFFAGTYFPVERRPGMPAFIDVIRDAVKWFEGNKHDLVVFRPERDRHAGPVMDFRRIITVMRQEFDSVHGGFGTQAKFPPHSDLLFLLHAFTVSPDPDIYAMAPKILDEMAWRGLHDHLQGGFFRYCVDREWTVPHFEKMLYDQAMLLWVYAAAHREFGRPDDKAVVDGIVRCLDAQFAQGPLFASAVDADADGQEGGTYLWTIEELKEVLSVDEFARFAEVFDVRPAGHVDGKMHLVKNAKVRLPDIEAKLLAARSRRPQPAVDRKAVTAWNALAGIGLHLAWRWCGLADGKDRAARVLDALLERNTQEGELVRSSIDGLRQGQGFLEDHAAVLALATFLHEDGDDRTALMRDLSGRLRRFLKGGKWHLNLRSSDFREVPAGYVDHPTPSPASLAEFALFRAAKLLGEEPPFPPPSFRQPLESGFHNVVVLLSEGNLHETTSPSPLPWPRLPITAMQFRGDRHQDCYQGACRAYASAEDLLADIEKKNPSA